MLLSLAVAEGPKQVQHQLHEEVGAVAAQVAIEVTFLEKTLVEAKVLKGNYF
jgi:hypothetical protein